MSHRIADQANGIHSPQAFIGIPTDVKRVRLFRPYGEATVTRRQLIDTAQVGKHIPGVDKFGGEGLGQGGQG